MTGLPIAPLHIHLKDESIAAATAAENRAIYHVCQMRNLTTRVVHITVQ
jgi:hypothetical protein